MFDFIKEWFHPTCVKIGDEEPYKAVFLEVKKEEKAVVIYDRIAKISFYLDAKECKLLYNALLERVEGKYVDLYRFKRDQDLAEFRLADHQELIFVITNGVIDEKCEKKWHYVEVSKSEEHKLVKMFRDVVRECGIE